MTKRAKGVLSGGRMLTRLTQTNPELGTLAPEGHQWGKHARG